MEIHLSKFVFCLQVCEGKSGHTEAVKVTYDKRKIAYGFLCDVFWETHDPTNKDLLVREISVLGSFHL